MCYKWSNSLVWPGALVQRIRGETDVQWAGHEFESLHQTTNTDCLFLPFFGHKIELMNGKCQYKRWNVLEKEEAMGYLNSRQMDEIFF